MAFNDTLDLMGLTDMFRTFHPRAAEYTFFSSTQGTFSRIDHILAHQTSLNKLKKIKIEIMPPIFPDHNSMKLEVNHEKISGKATESGRLNNMLLNKEWLNQETKGN